MSKCENCKKYDDCRDGSGLTWPCGAYRPIIGELLPEEVQELAKAKAEGRLVVLPCKVGDELWLIRCGEIRRNYAYQWHLMNSPEQCFLSMYDDHCGLLDFGKTVFLTREEAEKALQMRESEVKEHEGD